MAHIVVRIPKEIKEYKEKLILGLNIRQLASSAAALGVTVPFYMFGREYISEDALSWLCIIIALPIAAFGFLRYNGMTFEQAAAVIIRFEFLLPVKRRYQSSNAFKDWINAFEESRKTKGYWAKRGINKIKRETMLEKAYLTIKAESEGDTDFDADKAELVTIKNKPVNNGKNNRNNKKKKIEKKKSKLEIRAEAIEAKQAEEPEYALTKKEFALMRRYRAKQHADRVRTVKRGKKDVDKSNIK